MSDQNNAAETLPPDSESPSEAPYDPHRFDAEPKRKSKKLFLFILIGFVVVVSAVGGSVMFIKARWHAFLAEREEKAKIEKEKEVAENSTGRKGKEFISTAALPESFGNPKSFPPLGELVTPKADGVPPPPSNAAPPPPPKKMLSDVANEASLGNSVPRPGEVVPLRPGMSVKARPKTVQEFANQAAADAPITSTPQASAANLGNRSLLLARGAFIPCVLETQLVSTLPGSASCVVPQHVYSDDGKVLLIDKGSKIIGEYKSNVKPGDKHIAILWQRIKTPTGVVLDVDSPAADDVGTMGVPGAVDNHWTERIGAAFLLSLVEDAITIEVAKQSAKSGAATPAVGVPVPYPVPYPVAQAPTNTPTATIEAGKRLSQQVLSETLNIPPTLYKNRGDRVMVFVNRDLWFDSVYQLSQR
ncbi:type IV secretion system protein VirB10 [Noviherbaspirillum sp.]|jgi:type IV secretion system protein VirB10|uniref:type IV secretion system protein VirB10 n=1 Tax=Noviherbaspirillum sp. TaxID=1926288 RepID=UPI0025FB4C7D|nr:type IV secretion system protein VirB10 [Noviherbaspirillum sp.]